MISHREGGREGGRKKGELSGACWSRVILMLPKDGASSPSPDIVPKPFFQELQSPWTHNKDMTSNDSLLGFYYNKNQKIFPDETTEKRTIIVIFNFCTACHTVNLEPNFYVYRVPISGLRVYIRLWGQEYCQGSSLIIERIHVCRSAKFA